MSEASNDVEKINQDNLPASTTPTQLLQIAVERGADMDQLQKLMDLQERWEANEARKAYVAAMNAFKQDPPDLFKNRHVSYQTSKGKTEYDHASLDHIANQISGAMSAHGLSFRWDTEQEEGRIRVTCVITHEQGHSERVSLQAGADESGGKNSIQAIGSTVSYLQRYTLLAATGLATKGMDDDGAGAEPAETITEEQVADLEALIQEVGADREKFMQYIKVDSLDQILAKNYETVVKQLERKRK